ncbi:thrombospondin type-1 domain-containing protein 4-like [Schistocerca piceifrons]|uniref:thrombospondin type-1 domain-containing protein 4-like n=1 Tax=Schistocerca piceifrons TaxID=274613 RepID=UPI001F5E4931|nr:thrombospondin type-1 domain-containing protein 4-like [Schistocerca piceifrons]
MKTLGSSERVQRSRQAFAGAPCGGSLLDRSGVSSRCEQRRYHYAGESRPALLAALSAMLLMAASVLMVSYGKTASKYPLQVHGPSQQRLGAPGHWAPWSAWSPCSRTCGGGVAVQTRDCRPMETRRRRRLTEPPPRSHCVGVYKRVHVCNDQECPPGSKDFRSAQCEAFNGKPFMGRLYLWEPFLQAPNPCELNCRAAGFRFYATLNKTVVDGTPCRGETPPPARHVCVAGVCQSL